MLFTLTACDNPNNGGEHENNNETPQQVNEDVQDTEEIEEIVKDYEQIKKSLDETGIFGVEQSVLKTYKENLVDQTIYTAIKIDVKEEKIIKSDTNKDDMTYDHVFNFSNPSSISKYKLSISSDLISSNNSLRFS